MIPCRIARQVIQLQLLHHAAAVGFHRARRKTQELCGLGIGFAIGRQPEDLALRMAELVQSHGGVSARPTQIKPFYRRSMSQVHSARRDRARTPAGTSSPTVFLRM